MTGKIWKHVRVGLVLACMAAAPGCLAAAAGGAAAGIYLTDQGASSQVAGSLAEVDRRTQAVLSEMGIQVEERKEEPQGFEYKGNGNGMEIRVELDAMEGGTTMVKASARKNAVEWDKSYARDLIGRIVARS